MTRQNKGGPIGMLLVVVVLMTMLIVARLYRFAFEKLHLCDLSYPGKIRLSPFDQYLRCLSRIVTMFLNKYSTACSPLL